jgi:hypothetical protein
MDRQTAIDRITETENLTDGLEDDDANWLLDWGIAHVDGVVTGITDEDAAGDKLNQLMAVMRSLNQIAADRAAKPPDALAADIRTYLERYRQAFGAPKATAPTAATTPATTTNATAPDGGSSATPAGGSQTPASGKPSKATPAPMSPPAQQTAKSTPAKKAGTTRPAPPADTSSATPPANATTQARTTPDQSTLAASKIAGMSPRDAMQYLISLAEAPTPGA